MSADTNVMVMGSTDGDGNLAKKPKINENDNDKEQASLMYGISLSHLAGLPIPYEESFSAACEYVKEQTKEMSPTENRSYAQWLKNNSDRENLVRDQATVFVSYAWNGGFGKTMDVLIQHFRDHLDETFVWMEFAIVDQHEAAPTNLEFREWTNKFRHSLKQIGRAVLVLIPTDAPITVTSAWCYFEWIMVVQSNIQFVCCVSNEDERKTILKMHDGFDFAYFEDLFASVDLEAAQIFKKSDPQAIVELMREVGITEVNNIVKKTIKDWWVQTAKKAERYSLDDTVQMLKAWHSRGSIHAALNELDEASLYFEKALACAKAISNNDTNIAKELFSLAGVKRLMGDSRAAETLYLEALAIHEKISRKTRPDLEKTQYWLADMYFENREYAKAEPQYLKVLAFRKASFGARHGKVYIIQQRLIAIYFELGMYEKAVQMWQAADNYVVKYGGRSTVTVKAFDGRADEESHRKKLAAHKKALGERHPLVAVDLSNLAGLLKQRGEYSTAEGLYRDALDMRRETLGDDHLDVARSLHDLALVLNIADAEVLLREALAIRKKALGPNHLDVADLLHNLAFVLALKPDVATAETMHREALAIRKTVLGENHPEVASSLSTLARLFETQRDFAQAESLYRQAWAIYRKSLGEIHPDVLKSLNNLIELLRQKKDYAAMESLFVETLAHEKEVLGEHHPEMVVKLYELGRVRTQLGKVDEAKQAFKQALGIQSKAYLHCLLVGKCLYELAGIEKQAGNRNGARLYTEKALDVYEYELGPEHPETLDLRRFLVSI